MPNHDLNLHFSSLASLDLDVPCTMRQLAFAMLLVLAASTTRLAQAQAEDSASEKHISAAVGGTISIFQPDFAGKYSPIPPHNALAGTSPYPLIGLGVYLDVKLAHWVQLEVEGRRLRFDQYNHIYEDNYRSEEHTSELQSLRH